MGPDRFVVLSPGHDQDARLASGSDPLGAQALVAHQELSGPVDALQAQRNSHIASVANKSLGQLVKAFFDTVAVPEGFQREGLPPTVQRPPNGPPLATPSAVIHREQAQMI